MNDDNYDHQGEYLVEKFERDTEGTFHVFSQVSDLILRAGSDVRRELEGLVGLHLFRRFEGFQGFSFRRRRRLFLLGNVRIHLDEVEGLGRFVELEAVVDSTHDEAACHARARELLGALGLGHAPTEACAYIDLLEAALRR